MFFVEAPVVSHELREISNKMVRKTITDKIVKNELGHESYILKDEEAYIVAPASALRYARRVIERVNKEEDNAEGQKKKTIT